MQETENETKLTMKPDARLFKCALCAGAASIIMGCQSTSLSHYNGIEPRLIVPSATEDDLATLVPLRAQDTEVIEARGTYVTPPFELLLEAGDQVEVEFLGAPHLNKNQVVRPDGRISLQLVGEVDVQGKSPAALQEELIRLYQPQLQQAELSVTVTSPRPVYVSGQVRTPGRINMDRPFSALEAIMQAGGFEEREAAVKKVVIIRHEGGKRYGIVRDLKRALKGKADEPFYLKPFDIVYVPRTTITRFNWWVEQYINRIIPRPGGISYSSEDGGEIIVGR